VAGARGTDQDAEGVQPPGTEPVELLGSVERVTYRHPESGYTVVQLTLDADRGPEAEAPSLFGNRATAVGHAPELQEGERLHLRGSWVRHPEHGLQFAFDVVKTLPPRTRGGLVRYLASRAFPGIGPVLAERIVAALGEETLSRIRADPRVLDSIRGLRRSVRASLVQTLREEGSRQEALAFFHGLGLGLHQSETVLEAFGPSAETRVREDPYVLARVVHGFGFATADKVAAALGIEGDDPRRRAAILLHALREAASEGHALLPLARVAALATALTGLGRDEAEWLADLRELERAGEVALEALGDRLLAYLPHLHASERGLAGNLRALLAAGPVRPFADPARLLAAECEARIELHPLQREAVLGCLSEPVALLTGGPGVGKTTLVKLVVRLAEAGGARVVLASPTGRAAKRLAEATGREASTVHRLLGWEGGEGRFAFHARRPLEADLVVVDEISMLDLVLAHHLVKAVQPPTRLVLVGDPHQLPSVSAGNVLADLLASGKIPTWRLRQVFRQAAESQIVTNAHRILEGRMPVFAEKAGPNSDFFFFEAEDESQAAERTVEVVTSRIPSRFGLDWMRDVQVLSSMYRGACGVDALNERLREALGTGGTELAWRDRRWRTGDRVIHVRNDYEKQVFNGDMGRIASTDADGHGLVVRFPEREVHYAARELLDLQPGFAITVHRSQGGEFPAVVLPIVMRHFPMLERHLVYTAITRATKLVVLVGSKRALARAIENARVSERESALAERLRGPGG